jgi:hypothetical protein
MVMLIGGVMMMMFNDQDQVDDGMVDDYLIYVDGFTHNDCLVE